MQIKKLNELFTYDNFSPFFYEMAKLIPEWSSINVDILNVLSIDYYFSNGERYLSPTVLKFVEHNPQLPDGLFLSLIVSLCVAHVKNDLGMLYKAMFADYNPINNYEMTENGTDTKSITDNTTDNVTKSMTDTSTTDFESDNENSSQNEIKKSGFNSTNLVTDTIEISTGNDNTNNTETVERSANETHAGQSNKTVSELNTHTFQRSGNIGVTTSQQMIESEIKLREYSYWNIVFEKINKIITLSIY